MSANETKNFRKILSGASVGGAMSTVVVLLVTLAVSALLLNIETTEVIIKTTSSAAIFISAAAGGFIAQKIGRGGAAIIGIITAAVFITLMLLGSIIFFDGPIIDGAGINAACAVAGAFLGALFSTFTVLKKTTPTPLRIYIGIWFELRNKMWCVYGGLHKLVDIIIETRSVN